MKKTAKKFAKKAWLLLFFNGLIASCGFANFAIISNNTSDEFFAQWVTFIAVVSFFEMLRSGLLQAGFIRLMLVGKDASADSKNTFFVAFLLSAIISFAVALLIFIVGFFDLPTAFILTVKFFPFFYVISLPRSFLLWYLQGKRMYSAYFLVQFITFGGFLVFLRFFSEQERYIFEVYTFLHALAALPLILLLIKLPVGSFHLEKKTVEALLNFGRYSLGTQLMLNMLKNTHVFMIGYFLGPSSVALYAIPLKLTELFDVVLRTLTTHIYPVLIKNFGEGRKKIFSTLVAKYIAISTLFFLLLAGLLFVFSSPLLSFLGASDSWFITLILSFFLISKVLEPAIRISGVALEAINQPNYNLYRYAFMFVMNIFLSLLYFYFSLPIYYVALVNVLVGICGLAYGNILLKKSGLSFGESSYSYVHEVAKKTTKKLSNKRIFFPKPY